jgi:hypothetical protein
VSIQAARIVAQAFLGETTFEIHKERDPITKVAADVVADPGPAHNRAAVTTSELFACYELTRVALITIGIHEAKSAEVVRADVAVLTILRDAALAVRDVGAVAAESLQLVRRRAILDGQTSAAASVAGRAGPAVGIFDARGAPGVCLAIERAFAALRDTLFACSGAKRRSALCRAFSVGTADCHAAAARRRAAVGWSLLVVAVEDALP